MRNLLRAFASATFFIALLASCNRNEADGQFIVRGQLLEDCSGMPSTDVPVQVIFYEIDRSFFRRPNDFSGIVGTGQTDSTGRFEIRCDYHGHDGQIQLRVNGQIYRAVNVEIEARDFDFGGSYRTGTFQTRVRVNTTRTFTSADTLFLTLSGRTVVQIFPIMPGLTPPVMSDVYTELPRDSNSRGLYLRWGVGRNAFNQPSSGTKLGGTIPVDIRPCDTGSIIELTF